MPSACSILNPTSRSLGLLPESTGIPSSRRHPLRRRWGGPHSDSEERARWRAEQNSKPRTAVLPCMWPGAEVVVVELARNQRAWIRPDPLVDASRVGSPKKSRLPEPEISTCKLSVTLTTAFPDPEIVTSPVAAIRSSPE